MHGTEGGTGGWRRLTTGRGGGELDEAGDGQEQRLGRRDVGGRTKKAATAAAMRDTGVGAETRTTGRQGGDEDDWAASRRRGSDVGRGEGKGPRARAREREGIGLGRG